jgi:hypothetical protein
MHQKMSLGRLSIPRRDQFKSAIHLLRSAVEVEHSALATNPPPMPANSWEKMDGGKHHTELVPAYTHSRQNMDIRWEEGNAQHRFLIWIGDPVTVE